MDVRFTYDLNGVLEVEATVAATKKTVSHVIARHTKGLSEAAIRKAVRDMERLKTHPRDEAVNHFVLARADRLYKELSADQRRLLGSLIDGFEAALESRDPDQIDRHRDALEEFMARFDPYADDPTGGSDD